MGREEHCKQISLACVGSAHSVWATLDLPPLMACVLSLSALFRLQVAVQANCLKQALVCMHFPGLSCSGSGSWVLHKMPTQLSLCLCGLPKNLNLSGLDLGSARNPGLAPCRATWSLSSVDWESTLCEQGQTQCGQDTANTPHTRQ